MADLFDYILWRGDLPMDMVPLNPVDTLILSELSYIGLDGLVPGDFLHPVPLKVAAEAFLDPIFIFVLDMGVSGAALATIISQGISAVWVLRFLFGKTAGIPLRAGQIRICREITRDIFRLGTASFIMQGTNCLVQVACNSTLQLFGGDLYVGIMTVINSIREIFMLPLSGMVSGAQPVISFNYGAKAYDRVLTGIRFNTVVGAAYNTLAWALIVLFPRFWFGIFSEDALCYAARRGVDVRIILPGIPDKKSAYYLAKTHFAALNEAGVKIFTYTPGFVHAKSFVVDDREAVVGTINLDYRSLYHHFECALYMNGVEAIADIEQDFLDTQSRCRLVTRESIKAEKWHIKLTGFVLKTIAPLL